MIGSTDSHTGISAIEENNFAGKGQHDSRPELRTHYTGLGTSKGWDMGAAGLVGVWAQENNRQSLTDAFKRKEVYASTGPRIQLRFFGGFDFKTRDARAKDLAAVGYKKGVAMGGDLQPDGKKAPTFLVAASKDPVEGNLDRKCDARTHGFVGVHLHDLNIPYPAVQGNIKQDHSASLAD